jgi:hypothetical protein
VLLQYLREREKRGERRQWGKRGEREREFMAFAHIVIDTLLFYTDHLI